MNFWKSVIAGLVISGFFLSCSSPRDHLLSSPPPGSPALTEKEKKKEGAPPKEFIVLLPEADGKVGKIRVTTDGNTQVIDKPWVGVTVDESGKRTLNPHPMRQNEVKEIFATALEVHPDLPNRFDSYVLWFESDKTELTPESKTTLKEIVKTIKNRKSTEVFLTGHTDRVGTDAHNLKLSAKRAFFVRDHLVAHGIKAEACFVSYHGEAVPLVNTEDEMPEPSNRRVEIFLK